MNYFTEIRQYLRVSAVHVTVIHSTDGQEPQQIVEGAEKEFYRANKRYEKVYVVFDRDEHRTYENAIHMVEARNGAWKNDDKKKVEFRAIVSVPCFELWLLLHFVDIHDWLHRHDALARLKRCLPGYEKGKTGVYAATAPHLHTAIERAKVLVDQFSRIPGDDPYTDVHELVQVLRSLKNETR